MTFYIIPSPIGNLDDITIRAKKILRDIDFLVVENKKVTSKLTGNFFIFYNQKIYIPQNFFCSDGNIVKIANWRRYNIESHDFKDTLYCNLFTSNY